MENIRDRIYTSVYVWAENLLKKLCSLVPAGKKYIWLESEIDFAENSRALYEYMISHKEYENRRLIWCVDAPEQYPPHKNVTFIKRNMESIPFLFYKNRCKYFIFTHPYWLKKWKKSQVVINTCHGNPFKAPPKSGKKQSDYALASSPAWAQFRRQEFGAQTETVVLGAPRNDWLYGKEQYLRKFTGQRQFQKTIFCMPTFKKTGRWTDSQEKNVYSVNVIHSREDLLRLNEELKKREILLVCIIHHLQVMEDLSVSQLSNILYLRDTDYGKEGLVMNQMLPSADALLTDCSGVFLDYILLDRPMGFFTGSLEEYDRGFAMENPEDFMPGQKIRTMEELLAFADDLNSGKDTYQEDRKRVRDLVHVYQDDGNCRRFLQYFQI